MYKRQVRAYDLVLTNSYFSRENMLRSYGIDATVCYLGVDTDRYRDCLLYTSDRVLDDAFVGAETSIPGRPAHAPAPLRALREMEWPVQKGDSPVAETEQVAARELTAAGVVDRDRAELALVAAPVEEDHESATVCLLYTSRCV